MPQAVLHARFLEEQAVKYGRLPREIEAEGTALQRHVRIAELGETKKPNG